MKIGIIVESVRDGLEDRVCPKILELLAAECNVVIERDIARMVNKKLLIQRCGETARTQLAEGCDRVVVLWDENPPWTPQKDFADDRCWHHEREQILTNLGANIPAQDLARVGLVCIEREFETWLFYDTELLRAVVRHGSAHPVKLKPVKHPLQIDNPKAALMHRFRENRKRFNPDVVAADFARYLTSLDRLKKCDTFRYFAQAVLGEMPRGWTPYMYNPRGPGPKKKKP